VSITRLFYWKKVAEALFSERQLRCRRQKARLLPAASSNLYCKWQPTLAHWKKVAAALFSEHHFVGRRQKTWFLPAATFNWQLFFVV
jgi:hypothetical protein